MRDTSAYVIDGVRLPSVTEILDLAGLVDWSMVPAGVLDEARKRGGDVHEWLELVDFGYLQGDEPPEAIAGFVNAYLRFKNESGFAPELVEHVVVSRTHRYAGTLDRTGKLNGKRALIDLKSGATIVPSMALQTAGYALCLDELHERYTLQLRPDGSYRLARHRDRSDAHDFLAATRIAHWQLRHGRTL